MPALDIAGPVRPATRLDFPSQSDTWASRTARCVTRWGRSGAVISVAGELDASNADQLAEYVHRCVASCEWLILDLNDLEFIGIAGFSSLQTISGQCVDAMVYYTMVPGAAVSRLLRICDPGKALPTTSSVADALAGVDGFRHVH